MKLRALIVMAALIAAATPRPGSSQTAGPKSRARKAPASTGTTRTNRALPQGKSRPAGVRPSTAALPPVGPQFVDPTGRVDRSGRQVPFYPSVRTMNSPAAQAPARGGTRRP